VEPKYNNARQRIQLRFMISELLSSSDAVLLALWCKLVSRQVMIAQLENGSEIKTAK
jgi:hypothetical protein